MASVELATGYVTLAVETRNLASQIGRMFSGADSQATQAGRSMGRAMTQAFEQNQPNMDTLVKNVEVAEQRVAAQAERSAARQEAAKRKVEIAQAKLNEATQKYGDGSSQALTAADRLATAQQKLEAETLDAASAQNRLQTELDQSRTALRNATTASQTASTEYASGWRGVGQRIKGYLGKGVKQATDDAERKSEKGGKESGGRFSSAFKGAIAGLAAGVSIQGIVQGFTKSINDAGDLEQSIGAIDSVFKNNSKTMHDWAKDAQTSVGLTRNEYNELGTLIGSQLKNAGTPMDQLAGKTDELIKLGADLSSMFGGTTREAVEAISSTLKGEMDPIEKYGITMSAAKVEAEAMSAELVKPVKDAQKIADARTKVELAQKRLNEVTAKYGKDSDQAKRAQMGLTTASNALAKAEAGKMPKIEGNAKALAIQNLLMKQSGDAQGNFNKESDTFAHKMQVAKAKWGDITTEMAARFLPAITEVMGFVVDKALPAFDGLVKFFQSLWQYKDAFVPLVAGMAAYVATVKGLMIFNAVKSAMSGVTAAQWLLNAAMKANPIGVIVTVLTALVTGLIVAYNKVGWFRDFVNAAWKVIADGAKWMWEAVIKPVWDALVGFITNTIAPAFSWLWNSVIKPAWDGIGAAIGWVWNSVIKPAWDALMFYINNILVPVWTWLYQSVIKPVWDAIGAAIGWVWDNVIKPIWAAIQWYINNVLAPVFNWLYNNVVKPVWTAISGAIKIAWAVIETIFLAVKWFIQKVLAPAFTWFYNNVIKPVWDSITKAIKWAWENGVKVIFAAIQWYIKNVLGPVFNWIYNNVIKPVWEGIKGFISGVWNNGIKPIFNGIKDFIKNTLGPVFNWLWKNAIKPAIDGAKNTIDTVWNKGIKPVFQALGNFIKDKVSPAFQKGVDAIKDIWNGIKNIAAAPINFVIGTVYNNGLRKALNAVRKVVGGSELPELATIPAHAKGGRSKKGWALVGEEGPELVNFSDPGRVYTAKQTQEMLAGEGAKKNPNPEILSLAAGNNPSEAMLPMGGNPFTWLGDKISAGWKKATEWVRGGLASAAEFILNPIKNGISGSMRGRGMLGDSVADLVEKTVDNVITWIRGKDKEFPAEEGGSSGAVYDGPLGKFHRPSKGPFTSMYGPRWGSFHAGVDIAGGGPTYAAMDGVVQKVGWNAITGRTGIGIVLNHGKTWTYYGHNPSMSAVKVRPGDKVKGGQRIGMQGATGNVTGTHLHFEVHKGHLGGIVNPMPYLHDNGGWLQPGLSTIMNKTGKPEAILNPSQWDTMKALADHVDQTYNDEGNIYIDSIEIPVDELSEVTDVVEFFKQLRRKSRQKVGK